MTASPVDYKNILRVLKNTIHTIVIYTRFSFKIGALLHGSHEKFFKKKKIEKNGSESEAV
jgi:hypothetical protein